MNKRNKGITLIALVITIIILLILAGVTISLVLGNNGLIDRAKQAKTETTNATNREYEEIENALLYVNEALSGIGSNTPSEPETPTMPKIPEGFYLVGGDLATGVVISDNSQDEGKGTSHEVAKTLVGNQFVWIPVDPISE